MADSIVADASAHPEQSTRTMSPREYLEFLSQLERVGWRLANNTRAYLVTLDPTGQRIVQPVRFECSVLNLETELASHLKEAMVSNETLSQVRDICAERLKERGITDRTLMDSERANLALRCLHELEVIGKSIKHAVATMDSYEAEIFVRGLLLRVQTLTDAAHACIGDDKSELEELREMVEGQQHG